MSSELRSALVHRATLELQGVRVPCILLGSAAFLFLYSFLPAHEGRWHKPGRPYMTWALRDFLFQTVVQLVPLFLIRWKCLQSSNRMALLSRFSLKVMLMYTILFLERAVTFPFSITVYHDSELLTNLLFGAGAFLVLTYGFHFQWSRLLSVEHRDVQILQVVAFFYALIFTSIFGNFRSTWLIGTFWNAMEICTFMPGAWLLMRMDKDNVAFDVIQDESSQKHALLLAAFLNVFYLHENIYAPYLGNYYHEMYLAAHIIHYVMVLEFTVFFLWQAHMPGGARAGVPTSLEEM